ncbi:BTAD domain-containing putative transcriptional regulator [Streptomyces sp. NPDC102360]|uniref:AfsR/SARP family transcriptional regulator n=1 Tax=Streptomyces sp. NPDC102360 TaxID=3366160 RepID=UPI00382B6167
MEFQLLGPVEARDGSRRIALSGSKVHTVLAVLLLARGRVVSDSRLSSLLWGWDPPATMNAQIYTYISRLRKLLGPGVDLIRRRPGYQLVAEGAHIDTEEFARLERLGRRALEEHRFAEAGEQLRSALGLWQGPALANVTSHLAEAELPQLEEARATALEHRIEADLALAGHQQLVAELTGLVAEFPLRERLRAQLMTALYRCGRQADALRAYHDGREVLAEELGVDPGADLTATYQAVLSGELNRLPEPTELPSASPYGSRDTSGGAVVPMTLPPYGADFTGREGPFTDLCARLTPPPPGPHTAFRPRRLLITGMAGVGKTALAVRVAHAVAGEFPDGQLYAHLRHPDGRVKDSRAVLVQLLSALGENSPRLTSADGEAAELDELVRRYRTRTTGKKLLVLLDDAANDLQLDALLPACADAGVLVTSRSQLGAVPGSHTTALAPMDEGEALALLATIVGVSRIALEPEAAREIAAHCAGLPLALRIAAARLASRPHWSAALMARRLADPAGRVQELRFGALSVRTCLQASLRQLTRDETELLGRLTDLGHDAFSARGAGPALRMPEAATEEFLERLVDVSLLEMTGIDDCGAPRYRLHELVRLVGRTLSGHHAGRPLAGAA